MGLRESPTKHRMNATAGYHRYLGIYNGSRCHMALGGLNASAMPPGGLLIALNDPGEKAHLGYAAGQGETRLNDACATGLRNFLDTNNQWTLVNTRHWLARCRER